MRRIVWTLVLFTAAVSAHSSEKRALLLPVQAIFIHESMPARPEAALGLQIERGASMMIQSRGLRLTGASSATITKPEPGLVQSLAARHGVDLVYWVEATQKELNYPRENSAQTAFCDDSEKDEPIRGSLSIKVRIFDAEGKEVWTASSTNDYRCSFPVTEAWDQTMRLLEKSPF